MRDVAARAGVSAMTVSYSLRNHPRVSRQTALRVQKLARSMGYRLDPATSLCLARVASRGRKGLRENLGFLHFDSGARERDVHRLAVRRASELGYSLFGIWLGVDGMTLARARSILRARGVRGILVGNRALDSSESFPGWDEFYGIELGQTHPASHLPRVLGNHFGNAVRALEQLRASGYVRTGLVCLVQQDRIYLGQVRAAFAVFAGGGGRGRRPVPPLVCRELKAERLLAWVRRYDPDSIFTPCPEVLGFLREAGIRVPESIGVAEYHDQSRRGSGIAALLEHRAVKTRTAVDLLVGRLARGGTIRADPPTQTLIDGRWSPGGTLR